VTNRCCPLMTAADRCLGHVGGTADEDEAGSGLAAMATSSTGGEVGPGVTTCLVGEPLKAARQLELLSSTQLQDLCCICRMFGVSWRLCRH
jgi:hypothetical protein